MGTQKFQIGDKVVISKKYHGRYNCIERPGDVIKIITYISSGTRNMYVVQWDDKKFLNTYYSYELEKYIES